MGNRDAKVARRVLGWVAGASCFALAALAAGCCADASPAGPGESQAVTLVSPDEAVRLIENTPDLYVLSVCHKWEFDYYRIPGSVLIPHWMLRDKIVDNDLYPEINRGRTPAKDQPILVYCSTGGRTRRAAGVLRELGFRKVHVLQGGMREWMRAGVPVEKTSLQEEEQTKKVSETS
jgi:rhodanese-related sulfurtransferase